MSKSFVYSRTSIIRPSIICTLNFITSFPPSLICISLLFYTELLLFYDSFIVQQKQALPKWLNNSSGIVLVSFCSKLCVYRHCDNKTCHFEIQFIFCNKTQYMASILACCNYVLNNEKLTNTSK